MSIATIGLFGTCGKSTWRNDLIKHFKVLGGGKSYHNYYNPQVPDGTWKPEMAKEEARHLATDDIIVMPVTDETYGFGSLGEIGMAIAQVLASPKLRIAIVYVASEVNVQLTIGNPSMAKASNNARKLVIEHLKKIHHPRVLHITDMRELIHAILDAENYVEDTEKLLTKWDLQT